MDNLDNVEISPALHSHIVVNKIVEEIVKKVQLMPQYEKLARNIDLVLYICNLIEELVYSNGVKNQPKGFKRDLALRVLNSSNLINKRIKIFCLILLTSYGLLEE